MGKLYGSIEAGGTKFVCAVGDEEYTVVDKTQFPTTTPEETIAQTIAYFKAFEADLAGIAIGSLGRLILIRRQRLTVISQPLLSQAGLT